MKNIKHLLLATTFVAAISTVSATPFSADGDVFLGLRSTAGTGNTTTYLLDLGSADNFFGTAPSGTWTYGAPSASINTELTSLFGTNWTTGFSSGNVQMSLFGAWSDASASTVSSISSLGNVKVALIGAPLATGNKLSALTASVGGMVTQFSSFKTVFNNNALNGSTADNADPAVSAGTGPLENYSGTLSLTAADGWGQNLYGTTANVNNGQGLLAWGAIAGTTEVGANSAYNIYSLTGSSSALAGSLSLSSSGAITYTAAAAVPEPSTWCLIASGALFVGFGMFRRRNS